MNRPKLLSIMFLFITFSVITCETRRETFANNIKKYAQRVKMPQEGKNWVKSFENKYALLFYTLTLKELNEVQVKYDLSDSLTNQIKTAPYARVSASLKVLEEEKKPSFYSYETILGTAIKEEDGKITFALIKTKSFANLQVRYDSIPKRKCERYLIFFKDCWTEWETREKPLTPNDKILISDAAKASAYESILKGAEILKKGDYELYMSDTGSIFSPDHKSVAHVTYFGDIAIGPVSELNALYPVKYDYIENFNFGIKNKKLTKKIVSSFTHQINYPKTKDTQNNNFNFTSGKFHKFNFVKCGKFRQHRFPREYDEYIQEQSKNGPFILEVKKTGKVILFEEKTNKIIWQTSTENQGTAPYNFHLTNDRILTLEDSTGKILYQSRKFINMPTIYYGFYKDRSVYNGQIFNFCGIGYGGTGLAFRKESQPEDKCRGNLNNLHIRTDNDTKYKINYWLRIKETKEWVKYDNQNYKPKVFNKKIHYDMFNATISDLSVSICYTVGANYKGWTQINCNGYKVDITSIGGSFIDYLIIYIKDWNERNPIIYHN